jgi:hypothetical protein
MVHRIKPIHRCLKPASPERRAFALRDELVDRGLVETGDAEALVHNAAQSFRLSTVRVVARAWVDPHFRQRLLVNATACRLGSKGPRVGRWSRSRTQLPRTT